MSIIRPKSIEETLISLLQDGEKKATSLITKTQATGKHVTKQGVYAALRKLKTEEVVVIYKGIVALNTAWIRNMRSFLDRVQIAYGKEGHMFDFLSLGNKESVLYSFSNTFHLDAFWGHAQSLLVATTTQTEPIYAYNPHYWFYIARYKTEKKLLDDLIQQKQQFLMTVGGETGLDKAIQSHFRNDYTQYAFKKLYNRPEYYITAIGDYLIEVYLDKKMTSGIERIYANHAKITPDVLKEFEILLKHKAHHKIKISQNKGKANTLRTKLSRNFFVKMT